MANSRTKNSIRKEAYFLKQLKSIYAWRGSLVDTIIEKFIVPRINVKQLPTEDDVINFSKKLIDEQLEFGRSKKYRLPNVTKSSTEESYCAFYDVEYNGDLKEEQIQEAKSDVDISLRNLVRSDFLKELMENSKYIISQRSLIFQYADTNISCTPDLIIFNKDGSTSVVDWKVHAFANADYRLQLGIYGFALSKVKPHVDFPIESIENITDPIKINLIEYQLLKNKIRTYSIDSNDIIMIENYIFQSIIQINRIADGKKYDQLDIDQFKTAISPGICESCSFKKLCWRGGILGSN